MPAILPLEPGAGFAILRLDADDACAVQAWDAFVLAHPQASFFHRSGWHGVLRQVLRHEPHFLYARSDRGEVLGVLPLAHVRTVLFGNALVGLPFAVYGGVVADDEQVVCALEQAAQTLAQQLGAEYLELRHRSRRHHDWPAQELYVSFRKVLAPDPVARLQAIPRKQRAMVRRGMQNGLRCEFDAGVQRFYTLYASSMLRHGTPALPQAYFSALRQAFGDDCEVLIICTPEGQAVSGVLSFYFRDEVLPYYAGDLPQARTLAANDFKYWQLMCRASARGVQVFDYGRSKQGTGSYAFKKNWGFHPTQLYYEYQLYQRASVPQHNPSNPRLRPLVAVWRKLPPALAGWLGPRIVRGLG